VVGVPHPDLGQVLCAAVTDGEAAAEARSRARTDLAPAQRPRRWYLLDELPNTPAGKIDRVRLASMLTTPTEGVRRLP
jgi:acyl-coenzyme A synthetase/AMP-(fatty) acid ligase